MDKIKARVRSVPIGSDKKVNKLFRKSWIWVTWSSTSRSSARRQVLTDGSSLPRMDCHGHASILFFALYDGMVPFTRILYFRIMLKVVFLLISSCEYCTSFNASFCQSCKSQYKKNPGFSGCWSSWGHSLGRSISILPSLLTSSTQPLLSPLRWIFPGQQAKIFIKR